jgi:hypothetical protein
MSSQGQQSHGGSNAPALQMLPTGGHGPGKKTDTVIFEYPTNVVETGIFCMLQPYRKVKHPGRPDSKPDRIDVIKGGIFLPYPSGMQEAFTNEYESVHASKNLMASILTGVGIDVVELFGVFGKRHFINAGVGMANAEIDQLYKGTSPRTFDFEWSFAPQSQDEAIVVRQIVRALKLCALPTVAKGTDVVSGIVTDLKSVAAKMGAATAAEKRRGSLAIREKVVEAGANLGALGAEVIGKIPLSFLGVPPRWEINFWWRDAEIFRILEVVLKDLKINYQGGGEKYNAYYDGMPVMMTVSATFQETNYMTVEGMAQQTLDGHIF